MTTTTELTAENNHALSRHDLFIQLYRERAALDQDTPIDNRETILDKIEETFGADFVSNVYGLLDTVQQSRFIKKLQPSSQEKAVGLIIDMASHIIDKAKQEGHSNIGIESIPYHFDSLLEPREGLYNPDDQASLSLLEDSEQFIAKISANIEAFNLVDNSFPVAARPAGDLFRLSKDHFALLHDLLIQDPPINEKGENILDFLRAPYGTNSSDMAILGIKNHHQQKSERINHYGLAFKEWARVFVDQDHGAVGFKTLIDTLKIMHRNGYSNYGTFDLMNPEMSQYPDSGEDVAILENHAKSKATMMKALAITNHFGVIPQFALKHMRSLATGLATVDTSQHVIAEHVLTTDLKRKYFQYIVHSTFEKNTNHVIQELTNAMAIFGADWPDKIIPHDETYNSLQYLFGRDDKNLLDFLFTQFPRLKDSLPVIDEAKAKNSNAVENSFIFKTPHSAEALRRLFPKLYEAGEKSLNERLRLEIWKTAGLEDSMKEAKDEGNRNSLSTLIEEKKQVIRDNISKLFVFDKKNRNLDLTKYLIESGYAKEWFEIRNLFELPKGEGEDLRELCINADSIESAYYFESFRTGQTDNISRNLGTLRKLFGDRVNAQLYHAVDQIYSGTINSDLATLGVNRTGGEGINQLKTIITKIKKEVARNKIPVGLGDNAFVNEFVFKFLRIGTGKYGIKTIPELVDKVHMLQTGEQQPADVDYQSDTQYKVIKLERSDSTYKIPADLIGSIGLLNQNLNEAWEYVKPGGESSLISKLQQKITEKIENSKSNLERIDKPQAQAEMKRVIEELSKINLQSLDDVFSNISQLVKYKECIPFIRTAIMIKGLKNNADVSHLVNFSASESDDSTDKLAMLSETIRGEIIGDELIQNVNGDFATLEKINNMFYLTAIAEEMKRARAALQKANTIPMDFVHSRELLLEFSGELADACWARRGMQLPIAKQYPNVHALIPRLNPGTEQESLVGATLIIETTTDSGEKILILRGDNPQQTFINSIDLESYHNAILNRAKEIAQKKHCKLAIALGTSSGQATTNRTAYFSYLEGLYKNHQIANLNKSGDSTFNGYVIDTNYCRLIDDFSENISAK